jgi:hypothetical protein
MILAHLRVPYCAFIGQLAVATMFVTFATRP